MEAMAKTSTAPDQTPTAVLTKYELPRRPIIAGGKASPPRLVWSKQERWAMDACAMRSQDPIPANPSCRGPLRSDARLTSFLGSASRGGRCWVSQLPISAEQTMFPATTHTSDPAQASGQSLIAPRPTAAGLPMGPANPATPPRGDGVSALAAPAPDTLTVLVGELEQQINQRCCHLIPHALGDATLTSPYRDTGLCGYRPQLSAHDCGHPLALICAGCGRPRCPECALRYERSGRSRRPT